MISDTALHERDNQRWAQLPAKAQLDRNRQLVHGDDGRVQYAKVIAFESKEIADAFSRAVWQAVDRYRARSSNVSAA